VSTRVAAYTSKETSLSHHEPALQHLTLPRCGFSDVQSSMDTAGIRALEPIQATCLGFRACHGFMFINPLSRSQQESKSLSTDTYHFMFSVSQNIRELLRRTRRCQPARIPPLLLGRKHEAPFAERRPGPIEHRSLHPHASISGRIGTTASGEDLRLPIGDLCSHPP
jgi:hypothetical protein